MKRLIILLASLLSLTAPALAQATNGSVTLTPFRGSTAFVPGAAVKAEGRDFHEGTQGYADPLGLKYRFSVVAQPGNVNCLVSQVEPSRLSFYIPFGAPVGLTSISISLRAPFSNPIATTPVIWSETIPLTIAPASPFVTGNGLWHSFRNPQEHSFTGGVLVLPRNVGIFEVALFTANLGEFDDWVVRIGGGGLSEPFELLALAEPLNQVRPENLYFQLPLLAVGTYSLVVYPLTQPGITSNILVLQIQ